METWITTIVMIILGLFSILGTIIGFFIVDKLKNIETSHSKAIETTAQLSKDFTAYKLELTNEIASIKRTDAICRAERTHATNDKVAEIDRTLADHQSQLDSTNKEIIEMKEEMTKRFDEIEQSITDLKDVIDKLPLILSQIIDRLNAQTPKTTPKIDNAKVAEQVTVKKSKIKGK